VNTLTVAAGIALRWYSIWYLGRFFTVDVAIAAGHRLIDTGHIGASVIRRTRGRC
jgi:protein-S-isoprenylcysteine O-methyltransferase Ste14